MYSSRSRNHALIRRPYIVVGCSIGRLSHCFRCTGVNEATDYMRSGRSQLSTDVRRFYPDDKTTVETRSKRPNSEIGFEAIDTEVWAGSSAFGSFSYRHRLPTVGILCFYGPQHVLEVASVWIHCFRVLLSGVVIAAAGPLRSRATVFKLFCSRTNFFREPPPHHARRGKPGETQKPDVAVQVF